MNNLIREDGYINATLIAKRAKKKTSHWTFLKRTQKLVELLAEKNNLNPTDMIQSIHGGDSKKQGTWIHELLVPDFAQWCSIDFATKIAGWIEEWKALNNNKQIYNTELNSIKPETYFSYKEKEIQLKLQKELGGLIEVETDFGFIDLLTNDEVIEIKEVRKWKSALGQVLVYASLYPGYKKRLHLFGETDDIDLITTKCQEFNTLVSIE